MRLGVRIRRTERHFFMAVLETDVLQLGLFQTHLAVAAVAASPALLAQMVGTGVFGAADADTGRLFFADAADEWHGSGHWGRRVGLTGCAGCRDRVARQRWASRST